MMAATVILCVVVLIVIGSNDDAGTAPMNQKDSTVIKNHDEDDPALMTPKQDHEGNVYEANAALLKKFVEVVYTSGKETEDLRSSLNGVATDDVIKEYDYQGGGVREAGEYKTSVHHAKYTVNETMGIALFEIKTVTDFNENTSLYLLQVSYDQGLISRVDRFTKIDE